MSSRSFLSLLAVGLCTVALGQRPPAVPLVAHDPYFSIWSTSDTPTGDHTRHWTGREHPISSMIRIDGKTYQLLGKPASGRSPLPTRAVSVLPTRTIYSLTGAGVDVDLTFTTPALPHNLVVLSRPATYITWAAVSNDGRTHDVQVYFDASGLLAVDRAGTQVVPAADRGFVKIGNAKQVPLSRSGDDLRIDWGHLLLSSSHRSAKLGWGKSDDKVAEFAATGRITDRGPREHMTAQVENGAVIAVSLNLAKVGATRAQAHAILAYDDEESVVYFERKLRPFWREDGATSLTLVQNAERDYERLSRECERFDRELLQDLTRAGGEKYAYIATLAYRQALAAQKIVRDSYGAPLMFSKENFSNGCIGTVDVLYPGFPQLLLFNPNLLKASLVPILDYAASPRWKFPFAPHDLGTYPLANGQVYGGGEETVDNQMPVEESGNMLIMLAALAKFERNADFCTRYWPQIKSWAEYLADKGFDPESQLSTDDFAGHLAHNVNLSAKAIVALGAYAELAKMQKQMEDAVRFRRMAEQFAKRWMKEAEDGDHYRLAFDKPGTWSQKYNLVWDRLLGLDLFPASVAEKEMAFYRKSLNPFGLPLDNRRDYTKLDWILWTAMLTGKRDDFETLIEGPYRFLRFTPDRVPMTDWFHTQQPKKAGFQARSVVGGVFLKLLDDSAVWRKYASRDTAVRRGWAPIPVRPAVVEVVPTARTAETQWRWTTADPGPGWEGKKFDDSKWNVGLAGFGTQGTPGAIVRTTWNTKDIWLRREFIYISRGEEKLYVHHDEDVEVYINGKRALERTGYTTKYQLFDIEPEAVNAFGRYNTIAVHCKQTGGGQYIDVGLAIVKPAKVK